MPYCPDYKVCKEWLRTGDCPIYVQYKDLSNNGSLISAYRIGLATADEDVLFLRRARWIDAVTVGWGVCSLPYRKKQEVAMSVGGPCSTLIRVESIVDMFFLEPALWVPFIDLATWPT